MWANAIAGSGGVAVAVGATVPRQNLGMSDLIDRPSASALHLPQRRLGSKSACRSFRSDESEILLVVTADMHPTS